MAHEKCVNLQGHSAQRSQESCKYKEKLWYIMDKEMANTYENTQSSGKIVYLLYLLVMRDCKCEPHTPHTDHEGALQFSTLKWRQWGRR